MKAAISNISTASLEAFPGEALSLHQVLTLLTLSILFGSAAVLMGRRWRWAPMKIAIMGLVLVLGLSAAVSAQETTAAEAAPQVTGQPSLQQALPDLKIFDVDKNNDASRITFGIENTGSVKAGPFTISLYLKDKDGVYQKKATETVDVQIEPEKTYYGQFTGFDWKWIWPKSEFEIRLDEEGAAADADRANNVKEKSWSYLELVPLCLGYYISWILIPTLLGTGLLITITNKFLQVRKLGHSIKVTAGAYDNPKDKGDVTHFQALSAALSATVGIGNIAGVAIAMRWGGPGALFWMWVTAVLGMSLKFAECTLAHKFRVIHEDGSASGGPMYYITQGLGRNWAWFATLFAICAMLCSFCTGNMNQANTIAESFREYDLTRINFPAFLLDIDAETGAGHIKYSVVGVFIAVLVGLVVIGGIKRIASVASKVVPGMAILYCGGSLLILLNNYTQVLPSFRRIIVEAFSPEAGISGGVLVVMMWGIRRGLYSNEAGQGSAPMAHAAAKTEEPVREGIVALMEPFIDTLVICTMTGITIVVTGALDAHPELTGAQLTRAAFEDGFGRFKWIGNAILTTSVFFFAYSTMISWSYYGDRASEYLFGSRAIKPYRFVYVFFNFMGCILPLAVVWNIGDVALSCMAIPNLIAIIFLSGMLKKMTDAYFAKKHLTYKEMLSLQRRG